MKIQIGEVELASFTAADTRALYTIRNHPTVRRYMTNPALIPYRSHVAWVKAHLIDRHDHHLFIVRVRARAIGFSLLRPAGDETEYGLMFREPDRYPMAEMYAGVATVYYAFSILKLDAMIGYLHEANVRALDIARAFGAWDVPSDKPGMTKLTWSRTVGLADETYRKVLARFESRMVVTE